MILTLTPEQKEKIWQGQYWGSDGVLSEIRATYKYADDCFASDVVMMSTEYSAANRALANLRRGSWRERVEAPLRLYDSFVRARSLALKAAPRVSINTTADSTEVVTTLLVRFRCIKIARQVLDNLPWHDLAFRNYVEPHTSAFLVRNAIACGLAENSVRNQEIISSYGKMSEERGDVRQALRVWRALLQLKKKAAFGPAGHYKWVENRIQRLLEKADSADQRVKTGV